MAVGSMNCACPRWLFMAVRTPRSEVGELEVILEEIPHARLSFHIERATARTRKSQVSP